MSRFVRNLLFALVGVYLVAQFVEAYQHLPIHAALGIDPSFHRLAFLWQWATYSWVETPGDLSLIAIVISGYMLVTLGGQFEQSFGRVPFVLSLLAGSVVGGLLGTLVGLLVRPPIPASGAFTAIEGAIAFLLWNRRNATMHMALYPGAARTFELRAKEMGAILVAFVLVRFVLLPSVVHLVVDLGGLVGGLGYAVARERRAARAIVRHSFTVVRGGKSDKTLH